MPANVFKYENRLAKTLVKKGGMNAEEAISSAQVAVDQVREPTVAEMDSTLERIYRTAAAMGGKSDPAALEEIYVAANLVVGVAGVFGLAELGKAAYSLCELISRFQTLSRYSEPMVRVHIDGLRLLRQPGEHSAEHRLQVLSGLRQVAASVV